MLSRKILWVYNLKCEILINDLEMRINFAHSRKILKAKKESLSLRYEKMVKLLKGLRLNGELAQFFSKILEFQYFLFEFV